MFSYRQNKQQQVPDWASSFFNFQEYIDFMSALGSTLNKRGILYQFEDGVVHLTGNSVVLGKIGLVNMAQFCKLSEASNWESQISAHLDELEMNAGFRKQFEQQALDFEFAKAFLSIRLFNKEVLLNNPDNVFVWKEFAGDAFIMLSFDLPNSVVNVKPAHVSHWNKPVDELFETGRLNIEKKHNFDFSRETINNFDIWFIQDEHHFVPNFLFNLRKYPALQGEFGALIGIPHRHAAIIYPIESKEVLLAINNLPFLINGMYNEGPGSISNRLFWYKDGQFEAQSYELGEDGIRYYPSAAFMKIMEALPERES